MEWKEILQPILQTDEMQQLKTRIGNRRKSINVLPAGNLTFNAFDLCPYDKTKLVILGQDPYPNAAYPHGLVFSARNGAIPDSLNNIFVEIHRDLYPDEKIMDCFQHGRLDKWATQGVLLINAVLTVDEGKSGSHKGKGWEFFTQEVFKALDKHKNNIVFMLWGVDARVYSQYVTDERHLVLTCSHPSPMSYEKGFKGAGHFKKLKTFLQADYYNTIKSAFIKDNRQEISNIADRFAKVITDQGFQVEYKSIREYVNFVISKIPQGFEILVDLEKLYMLNFKTIKDE